MDKMALINGKMVELPEDEKTAAEEFHKKRVAFAFLNNELLFNEDPNDDRDHHHWLTEDYGISEEEFEQIPRGFIIEGRVQFFKGSDFGLVDKKIIKELGPQLYKKYRTIYQPPCEFTMYNGVRVGKVGEIWEPIEFIIKWKVTA